MSNEITGKTGHMEFAVSGATARITLDITGWTANFEAAEHRVDNTGTNEFADRVTSIKNCTFQVNAMYNAANNAFDGPPAITAGLTVSNMRLYLQGTSSAYVGFATAKLLGVSLMSDVNDVTKWTLNGANKGTFTYPTGTFTASVS